MQTNTQSERKRLKKTVNVDCVVWEVAEKFAAAQGVPVGRWLENYLFDNFKVAGHISKDTQKLEEGRGRHRKSSSAKKPREVK